MVGLLLVGGITLLAKPIAIGILGYIVMYTIIKTFGGQKNDRQR